MKPTFQSKLDATRKLRRDYMIAVIDTGRAAIDDLRQEHPALANQIERTFAGQPARAGFWVASDRDFSHMTPLQQLARGEIDAVAARITAYVRPLNRAGFNAQPA